MNLPFLRPKIEYVDLYLAKGAYDRALAAIDRELSRRPDDRHLLRRQADIFELAGDRERSIEILRRLARAYSEDGFHTRAAAIYKEILQCAPSRRDIHAELAQLIDASTSPFQVPTAPADRREKELAASALFTLFNGPVLEELLSSTRLRTFAEGDIIVTEGEAGFSLFVIVEGEVKVFTRGPRGEHIPLAHLAAGDLFGEVSVLHGKPRTATITARTAVSAIEIDKTDIDRLSQNHPQVRTVLEKFCEQRAQQAVEQMIKRMRSAASSEEAAP